jgi:hypothetical protein
MFKYVIMTLFIISACAVNTNQKISQLGERLFQFTYSVDIPSTEGEKMEMWIPLPSSNEVQVISNLSIDTQNIHYEQITGKDHGNTYLYLHEPEGTTTPKSVTIQFHVVRREQQVVEFSQVEPNNYLGSYSVVPVGGVFEKIISENKLSKTNHRGIYDFVLSGMHYGKPKSVNDQYYSNPWLFAEDRYGLKQVNRDEIVHLYQQSQTDGSNYTFGNGNAIYACDIGVGNCTDYHSYFLSLNRTLDIPARFHMGFPIPKGKEGIVKGYHCWADYFVEGEGWYPVDISEADKHPEKKDYFFGAIDENRVEFVVGRDIKLKELETDRTNLFIYPILEINDHISTAFSKQFAYKDL